MHLVYVLSRNSDELGLLEKDLSISGYRFEYFADLNELRQAEVAPCESVIVDFSTFSDDSISLQNPDLVSQIREIYSDSLPIISVLKEDSLSERLVSVRNGYSRYIIRPFDTDKILGILNSEVLPQSSDPFRVLVLADDSESLELEGSHLSNARLKVLKVSDPQELLEDINHFHPDALIIDVDLPTVSGFELALMLREHEGFEDFPIILVASASSKVDPLIDKQIAGVDFFLKPLDAERFAAAVICRVLWARQKSATYERLKCFLYERELEHNALNQHAIVSITDKRGRIIYANDKFCEISGYSRDELIGQNHRILKSNEHQASFFRDMWQTIAKGNVWNGTICNKAKDNHLYWVESTITPLLNEEKKPYQYLAIRTDVSPIKKQQLALKFIVEATINATHLSVFDNIVKGLTDAFEIDIAFIASCDARKKFQTKAFIDVNPLNDSSSCQLTTATYKKIMQYPSFEISGNVLSTITQKPWFAENKIKALFYVPLYNSNRALIGLMGGMDRKSFTKNKVVESLLQIVAGRVVSEIERSETERHLTESEEKFRSLVRDIPGLVYRQDKNWKVEYISNNKELFGYIQEEFVDDNKNWLCRIHTSEQPGVLAEREKLKRDPISLILEYRIRHKNGEWRWVSDHKRSIFNAKGKFVGIDGIMFDITERKLADLTIEKQKERLRRGQIYANLGTWDFNIVTGELFWTERIGPLFGYPDGDLETTYENFLAAVHPDDRELVLDAVNACIEKDKPYDIEHRVVWPDGTVRWLQERGAVLRDSKGNALQMLGVVQDIHERKITQLALAERERQLEDAQALAHLGNWRVNLASGEILWSKEVYRIFGVSPDTFKPSREEILHLVHPFDRERFCLSKSIISENLTGIEDIEYRIIQPNGKIRYIHEVSRNIFDMKNNEFTTIGTYQDISYQKEAEIEIMKVHDEAQKARSAAEKANSAKSEFLSNMSHELRTPMNAILGFSQLLKYNGDLNEDEKENVEEISKAGKHLLGLINDILDLSKIESNHIYISIEPVDVCKILKECLTLTTSLCEKRNVSVHLSCDEGTIVSADRIRLKQVFLNLLSNAIKYNRENGSVTIATNVRNNGFVQISFSDTGIGICESKFDELFVPFNRMGAENSDIEGTGIGLTITKNLVELMKGKIWVESELGGGACFYVEIPSEKMTSHEVSKEQKKVSLKTEDDNSKLQTLLYIEDNPANLKLMQSIFYRDENIELLSAHTPEMGIEIARRKHPDLILLDIGLPEISGYDVMNIFQQDEELKNIPVIAITASAMPLDIAKGKEAGFVHYVTKPFDIIELKKIVRNILKN